MYASLNHRLINKFIIEFVIFDTQHFVTCLTDLSTQNDVISSRLPIYCNSQTNIEFHSALLTIFTSEC